MATILGDSCTGSFNSVDFEGLVSASGFGAKRGSVKKGSLSDEVQAYRPSWKCELTPIKVTIEGSGSAWIALCRDKTVGTLTLAAEAEGEGEGDTLTCEAFISDVQVSGLEADSNEKVEIEFTPTGVEATAPAGGGT